ncbi:MAG: DUF1460 domain-containing protein [Gemmatimonadetes bacterium]|nr:DUF1460 domain-containing protein [Gemmatimonadota bacterium]
MRTVTMANGGWHWLRLGVLLPVLAAGACAGPDEAGDAEAGTEAAEELRDTVEAYVRPTAEGGDLVQGDTIPGHESWTEQDWEVLTSVAGWAWENGVDRLPVGQRIARIGEAFVGTDYIPQTLDPPGPERLVVNLRALDCVTFVEAVMVLSHFVRVADADILQRRDEAIDLYSSILTDIRYRNGEMGRYSSRLHYFSEWVHDNEQKGYVRDVSRELGGVVDDEPIDFMTEHRDAYRQLIDDEEFEAIARIEERLSGEPRAYIPQDRVEAAHQGIQDGDVIAMTSTLDGLDVAHTGIAVWKDGAPRLLNAPLVGEEVHVSEASLADRLAGISAQDGMIVARPQETDGVRGRF